MLWAHVVGLAVSGEVSTTGDGENMTAATVMKKKAHSSLKEEGCGVGEMLVLELEVVMATVLLWCWR
jgi:hypothetical protein